MDNFMDAVPKYTTTIAIPIWLAKDIKAAGMSYGGALVAGWNAMIERRKWNEEIAEVRANMEKYRSAYIKLNHKVLSMEADNGMENLQ